MKRIEAIVRRDKLTDIKRALSAVPHRGLTTCDVLDEDTGGGSVVQYRGTRRVDDMAARSGVWVLVDDAEAQTAVAAIAGAANTGFGGDGTILVLPVEDVVAISGAVA